MGRLHHMERLALGRSAFAELTPDEVTELHIAREGVHDTLDNPTYVQQYDHKGRPYNLAAEESKRALRHAQNRVLEIVGAVEGKTKEIELKVRRLREQHRTRLQDEDECGGDLLILQGALYIASTYLPSTLVSRVQAGLYPYPWSSCDTLQHELNPLQSDGLKGALSYLLAGAPAQVVYRMTRSLLYFATAHVQDLLHVIFLKDYDDTINEDWQWAQQDYENRKPGGNRSLWWAQSVLSTAAEAVYVVVDVGLLPLSYHAWVQMLGMAPSTPLFPPWRSLLPYGALSLHNIIWTPLKPLGPFKYLTSPASLMLLWTFIHRNADEDNPLLNQFTRFRYPAVNTPPVRSEKPVSEYHFYSPSDLDTLGRHLFYRLYFIRNQILTSLGYTLQAVEKYIVPRGDIRSNSPLENNMRPSRLGQPTRDSDPFHNSTTHRSTALALLPVSYLSQRIDSFLTRPLTFLLETTMLRAITRSYLTSTLPKTALAIIAVNGPLYASNGGSLGHLQPWKADVRKLGLGLAFYVTTEVGIFFALYGIARWQGTKHYGWTKKKG